MDDKMSLGEKFLRDAYDKFLAGKESFDEDMQKCFFRDIFCHFLCFLYFAF